MDLIQEFEKDNIKRTFPKIKPGDTIRVHQKIVEAGRGKDNKEKERIQVFEGLVIRKRGGDGLGGSFTIRKIASGVGVEKNFPIHLPSIVKIEFVKRGKVRRSNLAYLKDKKEKDARLQEIKLTDKEIKELEFDELAAEEADKKAENKSKDKEEKKEEPKSDVKAGDGKEDKSADKQEKAKTSTKSANEEKKDEDAKKPKEEKVNLEDKSKEDEPNTEPKKNPKSPAEKDKKAEEPKK